MTTTVETPRLSINHHTNDYITDSGVRICTPLYLDLSQQQRKTLLSELRTRAAEMSASNPVTRSGISVESTNGVSAAITQFLGVDLEMVRQVLFQRGGLSAELVLRLQEITGVEVVSTKEIEAAFKARVKLIKDFEAATKFTM